MKIEELAFACSRYGPQSNNEYDVSYRDFLRATNRSLDLNLNTHRKALLVWLNKWDCRQFKKNDHGLASDEIKKWYDEFGVYLPPLEKTILELSDVEIKTADLVFQDLAERTASIRSNRGGGKSVVRIYLTGAAKILFALRPNAFMPWDKAIRDELGMSYANYLRMAKADLEELGQVCEQHGRGLSELPALVGRSASSLPKLIDEYHWVTITKKTQLPSDLSRWNVFK